MTGLPLVAIMKGTTNQWTLALVLSSIVILQCIQVKCAIEEEPVSETTIGSIVSETPGDDHQNGSSKEGEKPVLYVNNPKLLQQMKQQDLLRHSFRISSGGLIDVSPESDYFNPVQDVSLLDHAGRLASYLRHIANEELGVTTLQATYDSSPYKNLEASETRLLEEIVLSIEKKLQVYSNLVHGMAQLVEEHHKRFLTNVRFHDASRTRATYMDSQEYFPCCLIPDHYLEYDANFGTAINAELWCDSGLGAGHLELPHDFYNPAQNLSERLMLNLREYPTIKWQYFMSPYGLHTVYPAHRSGTSVGSECGHSSRHRHIYEASVRSKGRNILLLYDVGEGLNPKLMLTAKAIGLYIISTLKQADNMAVLGVGDTLVQPEFMCLQKSLLPVTYSTKQSLIHFINYLSFRNAPTNHTLGLVTSLDIIHNFLKHSNSSGSFESPVLLIYVSRGIVSTKKEISKVMQSVADKLNAMQAKVTFAMYGLEISEGHKTLQKKFLKDLAHQEFSKYNIKLQVQPIQGKLVPFNNTLSVAPILSNFYDVAERPGDKRKQGMETFFLSEPYWDDNGKGVVVSLSQAVYTLDRSLIGVVGLDVALAELLENAVHFTSPADCYVFVLRKNGNILSHPLMGRPEVWTLPLIPSDVSLVETATEFNSVRDKVLSQPKGHKAVPMKKKEKGKMHVLYWWREIKNTDWVAVMVKNDREVQAKRLSKKMPPVPSSVLFHRLDLLPPKKARVCRHFNQMSTLDSSSIFLSAGSYVSPHIQLATGPESPTFVQNIIAYLEDADLTIANPGLRPGVKTDSSAVAHIASLWKKQFMKSGLRDYVVRRFVATPTGVFHVFPGTLLERTYDPRGQSWYQRAIENPGKVVVSAPYLDPGGAGHIVTLSHTIYQGRPATLHSPSDPVVAVVGADFTLGFWHKMLLDYIPGCGQPSSPGKRNNSSSSTTYGETVRCFLVDSEGFLVAHPAMMDPMTSKTTPDLPRHFTHQEPLMSIDMLNQPGVLTKRECGRWWHGFSERQYKLNLTPGHVVSNTYQADHCTHYGLTLIPGTNLYLSIINQTCSPPAAFCPCSMVDRLCLNCNVVEAVVCECPCECSLPISPCEEEPMAMAARKMKNSLWSNTEQEGVNSSSYSNAISNEVETLETVKTMLAPLAHLSPVSLTDSPLTCSKASEPSQALQYSVRMLGQLEPCMPVTCKSHDSRQRCMGVLGCVWCSVEGDGHTRLKVPQCMNENQCHGGILGGPSPYHNLATLPHSDNDHGNTGNPIGPRLLVAVAGGVMAVFLVLALAVYCYRQHLSPSSSSSLSSGSANSRVYHRPLYTAEPKHDMENIDDDTLGHNNLMIQSLESAAATISPYRMNPTYRRPTTAPADSSDHGYSTMTPHDDSENVTYTDLGGTGHIQSDTGGASGVSNVTDWHLNGHQYGEEDIHPYFCSSGGSSSPECGHSKDIMLDDRGDCHDPSQTLLSSPKRIGPNQIIVPVTVHMVDSV